MDTLDLRHNWRRQPELAEDGTDLGTWVCECLLRATTPRDGFCANKIARLRDALAPVVAVADEYDAGNLEEARPEFVANGSQRLDQCELAATRGGRTLLTVADALKIRAALRGQTPEDSAPLGIRLAVEEHGIQPPWTWAAPAPGSGLRAAKVWKGERRSGVPVLLVCACGASGPPHVPLAHTEGCARTAEALDPEALT